MTGWAGIYSLQEMRAAEARWTASEARRKIEDRWENDEARQQRKRVRAEIENRRAIETARREKAERQRLLREMECRECRGHVGHAQKSGYCRDCQKARKVERERIKYEKSLDDRRLRGGAGPGSVPMEYMFPRRFRSRGDWDDVDILFQILGDEDAIERERQVEQEVSEALREMME